jgi:hypothetical protein
MLIAFLTLKTSLESISALCETEGSSVNSAVSICTFSVVLRVALDLTLILHVYKETQPPPLIIRNKRLACAGDKSS